LLPPRLYIAAGDPGGFLGIATGNEK